MSENTRKAVVTTAQVQAAFDRYKAAHKVIGTDLDGSEFDKGARGKGFAEYDAQGAVSRSFDSKEDALTHYGLVATGMWTVIHAAKLENQESETTDKPAKRTAKSA